MRLLPVGIALGLVLGVGVVGPLPVVAQPQAPDVAVTAPAPPSPAPELQLEPTAPPEQTHAREQEFYPGLVRSRHDPAFVSPMVTTIPLSRSSAVRVGLSGWTAPAVPFDIPQASGGVAFGFTLQWGIPIEED